MRELALFAGAGGGILGGVLLGWRCVGAVEIDPYCREVLLRRQEDGSLPPFPIWDDIRTFDGRPWRGLVDVVTAGFPCQPWSVAGRRAGERDDRNLWPDTCRVLREVGPRYAFLENVPGLCAHDYFGRILGDLAEAGYDAEWDVISAAEVGAPHIRKRLWIVATQGAVPDACGSQLWLEREWGGEQRRESGAPEPRDDGETGDVADAERPQRRTETERRDVPDGNDARGQEEAGRTGECHWWVFEPGVGRVADGVAHRVDRLRALGNGQVPRVAVEAWMRLMDRREAGKE